MEGKLITGVSDSSIRAFQVKPERTGRLEFKFKTRLKLG